jgi:anti-sigma-K factor RskA
MTETPKTEPAADDPEALRKDIADKRRELGDTAAELAAKADVKSQVKEKVDERKDAVREAGQKAQETVTTQASRIDPRLLGVAVVIVVLLLVLRRRRR